MGRRRGSTPRHFLSLTPLVLVSKALQRQEMYVGTYIHTRVDPSFPPCRQDTNFPVARVAVDARVCASPGRDRDGMVPATPEPRPSTSSSPSAGDTSPQPQGDRKRGELTPSMLPTPPLHPAPPTSPHSHLPLGEPEHCCVLLVDQTLQTGGGGRGGTGRTLHHHGGEGLRVGEVGGGGRVPV